jgi:hypothetical protein
MVKTGRFGGDGLELHTLLWLVLRGSLRVYRGFEFGEGQINRHGAIECIPIGRTHCQYTGDTMELIQSAVRKLP